MFHPFRSLEPPMTYKLDGFQRVLSSYIRFNVIQHWYVSKHWNRRMWLPRITVFDLSSLKTRWWIRPFSREKKSWHFSENLSSSLFRKVRKFNQPSSNRFGDIQEKPRHWPKKAPLPLIGLNNYKITNYWIKNIKKKLSIVNWLCVPSLHSFRAIWEYMGRCPKFIKFDLWWPLVIHPLKLLQSRDQFQYQSLFAFLLHLLYV